MDLAPSLRPLRGRIDFAPIPVVSLRETTG